MRRSAWAIVLVTILGGCMSTGGGPEHGGGPTMNYGKRHAPPSVPGVAGPYGEKVPMAAPYAYAPPANPWQARQMLSTNVPLGMVQRNQPGGFGPGGFGPPGGMMPPTVMPSGGILTPPGIPFMPGAPTAPGGGPGMPPFGPASFNPGSPGGGVINAHIAPGQMPPGGVVPAQGMVPSGMDLTASIRFPTARTQVLFTKPSGMKVYWYTRGPDGKEAFSTTPIHLPGRYNFSPGVYRLKLSNIPGRADIVDLYPTMEVVPCNPKTEPFLAHSAVPLHFTESDFRQVADGNYLVKVIYLPDPQFQDLAGTGIGEIVNNPLEPGMDPIQEALRRGSILLIIRMGNVDQEAPNTPPLSTPPPGSMLAPGFLPPGMTPPPGMAPSFGMMPPGMAPDPRMGPLFQIPMYGSPPGTMMPPPGFSGRPMPGVTPLPPGMGGPDAKVPPRTAPPGFGPGAPFLATPGAPFTVPSTPLPGPDLGIGKGPSRLIPGTGPATALPATPITAPPIPRADVPALIPPPPPPAIPGVPAPGPVPALPSFPAAEPALPGLPLGPTSSVPATLPTTAELARKR